METIYNKYMERVSIIEGKLPILIIAPHGFNGDDENTSIIAEHIATSIDAYAVINNGWERSDSVDIFKDKADCNNIYHCKEDVVKEEFLEPIIRFKNKILRKNQIAYIFYIHGMANRHRKIAKDPHLDVVVGYGAGQPNSFSCDEWQKNYFIYQLNQEGITAYEGKSGGSMSGWSRNNMNQYFRKWDYDANVSSMQIEIIHELRSDNETAILVADYMGVAIKKMTTISSYSSNETFKKY
jgi:hypothetical protein